MAKDTKASRKKKAYSEMRAARDYQFWVELSSKDKAINERYIVRSYMDFTSAGEQWVKEHGDIPYTVTGYGRKDIG